MIDDLLCFRLLCKEEDGAWQPFSRDDQDAMFEKIFLLFHDIMNVEVITNNCRYEKNKSYAFSQ